MTRTLGLLSLVIALAVGGYLLSAQLRTTGPTSKTASSAVAEAGGEVATLNLQQAALALEQFRAANATYFGADLAGFGVQVRAANATYFGADLAGFGVQAVRADAASYCVQTLRAPMSHLAGPGGTPAAGAC